MVDTIGFSVLELVKVNSNILGSDGLSASVISRAKRVSAEEEKPFFWNRLTEFYYGHLGCRVFRRLKLKKLKKKK